MTRPYEPPKSLADLGISDRRAASLSDEQLRGLVEQAQQRDRQRHAELLLREQEAAQAENRAAAARKAATPSGVPPIPPRPPRPPPRLVRRPSRPSRPSRTCGWTCPSPAWLQLWPMTSAMRPRTSRSTRRLRARPREV